MPAPRAATLPRSFLYVPGDRDDLIEKALRGDADALVLDLEDAVAAADKAAARALVGEAIRRRAATPSSSAPALWVRLDSAALESDLEAVVGAGLDGVVVAKCEPEALQLAGRLLDDLETSRGLAPNGVGIVGLLESATAVTRLPSMVQHSRIRTFGIGEVDLLADLRMRRGASTAAALDSLRARIVLECAAGGCEPPVAPTSTDFRDLAAFAESSRKMLDLGFRSRTAIHPSQIAVIHEVFSPSEDEIARARDVVDRLDAAFGGVTVDARGRLIDAAVIRSARETLLRADR